MIPSINLLYSFMSSPLPRCDVGEVIYLEDGPIFTLHLFSVDFRPILHVVQSETNTNTDITYCMTRSPKPIPILI